LGTKIHKFTSTPPGFTASTWNVAFGDQPVGTGSAVKTVSIQNAGVAALSVSAVTLTGATPGDFAITSNSCVGASLPRNGACSIGVAFAPQLAGQRTAWLSFTDSSPGSPHRVSLAGSGVAGTAVVVG